MTRQELNAVTEAILRQDGHGRIEGAYFEQYTVDHLLRPLLGDTISTGWWFASSAKWRYQAFKLHTGEAALTATDQAMLMKLEKSAKFDVHLVFCQRDGDNMTYSIRSADKAGKSSSAYEDAEVYMQRLAKVEVDEGEAGLIKLPGRDAAHGRTVDARMMKVLENLDSQSADQLALERKAVNTIINKYYRFIYDLDAVATSNGILVGFELKRKYPEPDTEFGLNRGLRSFLKEMTRLLPIYYIILVSACWNKDTSPFILIDNPDIADKSVWVGKKISWDFLDRPVRESVVSTKDFGLGDDPKTVPMYSVTAFSLIRYVSALPETSLLETFVADGLPNIEADFLSSLKVQDC